jgi:hypothetical protein
MPITNPTTWRWPDSTFGPQNKVPFNDNNQYPDCGPSSRSYVAENILYGLENVILPILTDIETNTAAGGGVLADTSYSVVSTASSTALPSGASKKVTLINPSTNTASMEVAIGSGGVVLPLEVGYSLVANVNNANRITVKQTGGEAETMYYIISN